jgi:soluble lytic murein transglycosylase-like protein
MINENLIRLAIRNILLEDAQIDPSLLGDVKGNQALVFGPKAKKFLAANGMTSEEIGYVVDRLHNMTVDRFNRYDVDFVSAGRKFGLKPSTLKAMAIEETTLGKNLKNEQGSSAAGVIQITRPTLDTFNKNLPAGIRYSYDVLLDNPAKSIEIAAHYIDHFLIKGKGLGNNRAAILKAYKTGPDSANYVKRVEAFKKFVDLVDRI